MTNISAFRKLGHLVSAACLALAMTCGSASAAEVPMVDGTHWVKSSEDVKKAYLVGLANMVQLEVAYNANDPLPEKNSFSPRLAKGLTGQTLAAVQEALDKWYSANPGKLQRPVIETIWFEIALPGLKAGK
jgi:hypothetical protein